MSAVMDGGLGADRGAGWERARRLAEGAGEGVEIGVAARWVGTARRWSLAGDDPFPAASTIKLAILVALFREVDAGRLDLNARLAVDSVAPVPGSAVLGWLSSGLTLPLTDLAYLMIAVSDNRASNLLLDAVGMDRVGGTISDFGLRATALNRRFLGRAPDPGDPENVTSAADLVTLLTAIAEETAATPASCERMRTLLALQQDRDRLARYPRPGVEFGGKSGTLQGLAHDAGLLSTPGGILAIAVLTRGFSDPYLAHATIGAIAGAMVDETSAEC